MKNILIIKQGALGDIIIATGLIKQIRKFHHEDTIWLLTSPQYCELFKYWDSLNIQAFARKGLGPTIKTICWIRRGKFARIYDLQSNDRSRIFCALSGVKEIVGNHPSFPYNFHPRESYTGQCHIYERMLEVLASAGLTGTPYPPFLRTTDVETKMVREWLAVNNPGNRELVILHAGSSASHPGKRWPYYAELATVLESSGYLCVWIGTDEDAELNRLLAKTAGVNATNEFSVIELVELGKQARFAVTNDSGPMHILSCSDIPVYSFFGPTNWRRNHAVGQEKRVISAERVSGKPFPSSTELKDVSMEYVLKLLAKDGLLTA